MADATQGEMKYVHELVEAMRDLEIAWDDAPSDDLIYWPRPILPVDFANATSGSTSRSTLKRFASSGKLVIDKVISSPTSGFRSAGLSPMRWLALTRIYRNGSKNIRSGLISGWNFLRS